MTMKIRLKVKNKMHIFDIKLRPIHGRKYTKYKICLSIMMVICIKQHLSNFEAQFMTKLNNTEAELKNSVAYKKAFILSRTFKFTVSRLKE